MKRLVFYSQYAFYKPLYMVFESLCRDFGLQGFVITHEQPALPKVYVREGYLTHQSAGLAELPEFVTVIPRSLSRDQQAALLKRTLQRIRPDFIWAHEEPNNFYLNRILRWFYFRSKPLIVAPVVENIWPAPSGDFRTRLRKQLWRRFNGILACASKSAEAIQGYCMPAGVPISLAWLPHLSPQESRTGHGALLPPKREGEFVVGFAGRIMAAKGWRVLLAAMTELPENFKCLIAGAGDEEADLRMWCQVPAIGSRVRFIGLLDKEQLWDFYHALDAFVLPSLTTPSWTEQLGSVLAEAMACGVPVIGSDSGAIPEVIGDCGLVVPENDFSALAQAIRRLADSPALRATYSQAGRVRFQKAYSIPAYVESVARPLRLKIQTEEGRSLTSLQIATGGVQKETN